jgi:GNAT superfamily N-acetyltransferase
MSVPSPTTPAGSADPEVFPRELERDVVADGGLCYHMRPIRPDDAPRLEAFLEHLSTRSVYLRFFTLHPTLSETEVRRFTTVDYVDRLALVATREDRLIAVARYDRSPGDTEAEVAFVVADEYQHHGIGSGLPDDLAAAARARGVLTFRADTPADNHTMLDVFRHADFPVPVRTEYWAVTLRFPITLTEDNDAARARRGARPPTRAAYAT